MKNNKKTIKQYALNLKNIVVENWIGILIDCILILCICVSSVKAEYTRATIYIVVLWVKEIYVNLRYRKNYIMVLFYFTIMFFVISRPLVGLFLKYNWPKYSSPQGNAFALITVSLSMLFINYGGLLYSGNKGKAKLYIVDKPKVQNTEENQGFVIKPKQTYSYKDFLLMASLIIWIVCFFCAGLNNIDKFMFVRKTNYVEYYVSYKNTFPLIINVFGTLFTYVTLIVLSLRPNKRITFLVLACNIIASVPILLMGMRNSFLMSLIFTFVYLLYRYDEVKEKIHSRKFIMWACISVLVLGVGMNFLGNSRINRKDTAPNMVKSLMEFAFGQGTTFDTIRQAYYFDDKLPEHISYTLGPVIDYIYYGRMGQILFNSPDLGNGNNILKATKGNNLSHHLSYLVMEDKYLEGHGRGSSYIAELYLDFGYAGVCIGSLLLGLLIQIIHCNIFKRVGSTIVYLGTLSSIWLIARASYLDVLSHLFTYHFWFSIFIVVILAFVIKFFVVKGPKFFRGSGYEN